MNDKRRVRVNMTAKEWLRRAYNIDCEINTLREERQTAYERACSMTAPTDAIRVSASPGNISESKFISYADYDLTIKRRLEKLYRIKQEIMQAISEVDDVTYRPLLTKRYLQYKGWEKIAEEMNYSYVHILRLHGKALKEIKMI